MPVPRHLEAHVHYFAGPAHLGAREVDPSPTRATVQPDTVAEQHRRDVDDELVDEPVVEAPACSNIQSMSSPGPAMKPSNDIVTCHSTRPPLPSVTICSFRTRARV
jgi:hypothetical protein